LIGKPVPEMQLPPLAGLVAAGKPVPGFTSADLAKGEVTLVNFFASWCVPCVQEHPHLVTLAEREKLAIFGINHKDPAPGGLRFIERYGNPYRAVGVDGNGRAAIEWGVYGMPESFLIDGKGNIVYKHVGPLTPESVERILKPAIAKARGR
jgi:cytochrome c biogenesis protein CcmG/thiol:disulfide interchange protein DsbE